MNTLEKARLLAARSPLKFQDIAIERLNLIDNDFSYIDKETQTVKFKKQRYIHFKRKPGTNEYMSRCTLD